MESDLNENEQDILESVLQAIQVMRYYDTEVDDLYNALDDITCMARYWLIHEKGVKTEVFT